MALFLVAKRASEKTYVKLTRRPWCGASSLVWTSPRLSPITTPDRAHCALTIVAAAVVLVCVDTLSHGPEQVMDSRQMQFMFISMLSSV